MAALHISLIFKTTCSAGVYSLILLVYLFFERLHTRKGAKKKQQKMEFQTQQGCRSRPDVVLYPPPVQHSRCRTGVVAVFRVLVALLAMAMAVLSVVGQVVPFCKVVDWKKEKSYSVWRETKKKYKKMKTKQEDREDNAGEKLFAILTVVCSVVGCVLCFVFVDLWVRHEQERRREVNAYANAQRYAEEMQTVDAAHPHQEKSSRCDGDVHRLKSPSSRHRFDTYEGGAVLHQLERRRRRVDRDVGIAAFSLLLAAAVASLVTVALMAQFYNAEVADEVEAEKGEEAMMLDGVKCFIAGLVLGAVAFLVLALPVATDLYLCCPPLVGKAYPAERLSRSDSDDYDERRGSPHVPHKEDDKAACGSHDDNAYVSDGNNSNSNSNSAYAFHANNTNNVYNSNTKNYARPGDGYTNNSNSDNNNNGPRQFTVHGGSGSPSPAAWATPLPQTPPPLLYVPAVVGTYPEALPGPTSMAHVTLNDVSQGVADGATAFPATQAAWRGSETPPDYISSATQVAAREGGDGAGRKDDSKTHDVYDSPVRKYD